MSFTTIYDIGGSAMRAQVMRLDTVASNLANADTAASSAAEAYKAIKPVFSALYSQDFENRSMSAQVQTMGVVQSDRTVESRYEPNSPLADAEGYVFYSNVNPVAEMADMMSASRAFQTSVEVMGRVSSMQQSLLKLGQ
ncbi:MAG TPA: flagellar basal body rod protein FlgC [Rheinheimera sp.]|uniref:flagellar basal body rod protein FlgC n=1 Tax=Rheinheimera sp. TaxID=1869214 RepID=UPI000ED6BA6F|nr:flagellar basal body rod protein FlgC [Rheinheimera sp.]HCU64617.1 flagellar basal body rod protein FlgC [Rheinheimera sp.]